MHHGRAHSFATLARGARSLFSILRDLPAGYRTFASRKTRRSPSGVPLPEYNEKKKQKMKKNKKNTREGTFTRGATWNGPLRENFLSVSACSAPETRVLGLLPSPSLSLRLCVQHGFSTLLGFFSIQISFANQSFDSVTYIHRFIALIVGEKSREKMFGDFEVIGRVIHCKKCQ